MPATRSCAPLGTGSAGEAAAGSTSRSREATASWPRLPLSDRPSAPAPADAAAAAVAATMNPRRSQPDSLDGTAGAAAPSVVPEWSSSGWETGAEGAGRVAVSRPTSTYRRSGAAERPDDRRQGVGPAGGVGAAEGGGTPDDAEEEHAGRSGAAVPDGERSDHGGEEGEDRQDAELEDELVVRPEVPDRPVLHRRGRAGRWRRRRRRRSDSPGAVPAPRPVRRSQGRRTREESAECAEWVEQPAARRFPILLSCRHGGNPVPGAGRIGREGHSRPAAALAPGGTGAAAQVSRQSPAGPRGSTSGGPIRRPARR